MTGPSAGPTNVMHEKRAMALPRSIGPHTSANTPGTLESGELANVPVRKRPTRSEPKFGAKAQRKLNAR